MDQHNVPTQKALTCGYSDAALAALFASVLSPYGAVATLFARVFMASTSRAGYAGPFVAASMFPSSSRGI